MKRNYVFGSFNIPSVFLYKSLIRVASDETYYFNKSILLVVFLLKFSRGKWRDIISEITAQFLYVSLFLPRFSAKRITRAVALGEDLNGTVVLLPSFFIAYIYFPEISASAIGFALPVLLLWNKIMSPRRHFRNSAESRDAFCWI